MYGKIGSTYDEKGEHFRARAYQAKKVLYYISYQLLMLNN